MLDCVQPDARIQAMVGEGRDAQRCRQVHCEVMPGDAGVDNGPVRKGEKHCYEERQGVRSNKGRNPEDRPR
jgi:hypothetical protein